MDVVPGHCVRCGAENTDVIVFGAITEDHSGEADALCQGCVFGSVGLRADVPMKALNTDRRGRKQLRRAKKVSLKQEVDIMEELGGRTQPGSGNQPGAKGDVRKKGELRVEAKYTEDNSFRVPLDDLWKIAGEASTGELPVYVIDFLEPGKRGLRDRFAVLHFNDLKGLLNAARNNR